MGAIIEIENLSFVYETSEILSGVSFQVEKGDYVALAGPNGAGKTTLIKAIIGLLGKPVVGIKIFGKYFENFCDWEKIGYLPQRINVFNPLFPATVKEVVGLGLLSNKSYPKKFTKNDEEKVKDTLSRMSIYDLRDIPIAQLSGGQQQLVFLARALVSDPELLILDEPSTALDPRMRQHFFEFVEKLNKENGVTVVLITHDISQVGNYANKLLYLDRKVIFYGFFREFCESKNMEKYFGHFSQHLICHQHD